MTFSLITLNRATLSKMILKFITNNVNLKTLNILKSAVNIRNGLINIIVTVQNAQMI
jgi:hypothetical protein